MNNAQDCKVSKENYGLLSVILVYTIWGIQALYWKIFEDVPLMQLLAHRIIWSVGLLIPIIIYTKRLKALIHVFKEKKKFFYILMCSILIGLNWLLNIYAAYSNQMIEASLGQYITPIVVITLGIFLLKENIKFYEILALTTALIGISIMTLSFGRIPLIALLLILTFSTYTFFKKITNIDPIIGITAETVLLLPFALIYVVYSESIGEGVLIGSSIGNLFLLISTGAFTAIPLIIFSYGVKLVNLSKIGFIQYYAPTLSLLIGIFIFKESFTKIHFISFGFIWTAILIVLSYPIVKRLQKNMSMPIKLKSGC
ncbi:EamA family transporter RarD [Crassaminicella thermophila]|uniref:EamA family transporter RarD n=1 Tax=Crassaminicella thermophila TaxID=2599308 RepID=A0A5C0SCQ1_CRATE|nr:EamA family transporter RarD [Crassaminicella thermophila]QEK11516.1 EamA family transporter RarD [Crassaminicella thermophila]